MSALVEALVAAQAELPCAIGKDSDGQIGTRSYRYLSLDKLIEATRPILQKHGLTIVQGPSFAARARYRCGGVSVADRRRRMNTRQVFLVMASHESADWWCYRNEDQANAEARRRSLPVWVTRETRETLAGGLRIWNVHRAEAVRRQVTA